MQNEKLAAILLVIVIVGSISVFLTVTYGEDILNALSGKKTGEKIIALGDCADVNYIGRYASNDTVFSSSYSNVTNKIGGSPLKILVSLNKTAKPPEGYETYASSILGVLESEYNNSYLLSPYSVIDGFMEELIGMKEGEKKKTATIPAEKAFGVSTNIGDIIDLTPYLKTPFELKIVGIQKNASMPDDYNMYKEYYGWGNETTLYVFKENWHYIGENITSYPPWENSTVVTKINESMIWMYTTPPQDKLKNFTWINTTSGIIYGENASSVTSMSDTTIIVRHNPVINSTISVYNQDTGAILYAVVNHLSDDKINASYTDDSGIISYTEFDRNVVITRNETQSINTPLLNLLSSINNPLIPKELAEQLFLTLRLNPLGLDSNFKGSDNALTNQTIYFEVEIVNVYKTS